MEPKHLETRWSCRKPINLWDPSTERVRGAIRKRGSLRDFYQRHWTSNKMVPLKKILKMKYPCHPEIFKNALKKGTLTSRGFIKFSKDKEPASQNP